MTSCHPIDRIVSPATRGRRALYPEHTIPVARSPLRKQLAAITPSAAGDFKNTWIQWRPKQTADLVRVHDFIIPEKGKAILCGVYDLTRNTGWVSVGTDHDTAGFGGRIILM
jgi:hypothetical protein